MYVIYIYIYTHTHTHTKAFLLYLIKAWERTLKERRAGEIGKHRLNEMGVLNMK